MGIGYEFLRGEIYYIERNSSFGSEQQAGRPAIIVSNDQNNRYSPTVEVVYLTTQPKHDLPTHIQVNGTGVPSIALCEQIHTIDKQRIIGYKGSCTHREMEAINIALMISLGIKDFDESHEREQSKTPVLSAPFPDTASELIAVKAQLKMMCQMYDRLLAQTLSDVQSIK